MTKIVAGIILGFHMFSCIVLGIAGIIFQDIYLAALCFLSLSLPGAIVAATKL